MTTMQALTSTCRWCGTELIALHTSTSVGSLVVCAHCDWECLVQGCTLCRKVTVTP